MKPVKLATYNVNAIKGRLEVLLRWLIEAKPDVVCLQELKAPQRKFPRRDRARRIRFCLARLASWNGVLILARDQQPRENRRELHCERVTASGVNKFAWLGAPSDRAPVWIDLDDG